MPVERTLVRLLAALLTLVALPAPSFAGEADAAPAAAGLTVAILDLADVPELAPRPEPEVSRPTWRTTFGSERETRPEIAPAAVTPILRLADTDVVLIQGVQAAAPLRRLFPPRAWRLVVSRRVFSAEDNVGFRSVRALPPTTAIAVRARQDLRVTARDLSLRLVEAPAEASDAPGQGAATAIRVVDRGRTVWLASISLPTACMSEDPPCAALEGLDAWRQAKAKAGEATVIGGRIRGTPPEPQEGKAEARPSDCGSHTIDSDLAWHRLPPPPEQNSEAAGTACISIIRLAN
ncbi:MAG: hypothetical protein AB7S70_01820 [Hyphomicrobium sp.]|uniref:hypothetical protein n=1 Tax=Hyphomicrobium sp. TaxID=82 RepID=UPI003D0F8137